MLLTMKGGRDSVFPQLWDALVRNRVTRKWGDKGPSQGLLP